jgi:hypothetical protein
MPTTTSFAVSSSARSSRGRKLRIVLGAFDGLHERTGAAGDQAHHLAGPRRERRRALDGVEHAEPARRAGPAVDEAAALVHARGDRVDRGGDARQLVAHRLGDVAVLVVHHRHEVERRQRVELQRARVPRFGRQVRQVDAGHGRPMLAPPVVRREPQSRATGTATPVGVVAGPAERLRCRIAAARRRCLPTPHRRPCRPPGTP